MNRAILAITAILALGIGAISIVQHPTAYGYGYGYGATTCTGAAPTGLTANYSTNKKQIAFIWSPVSFSNCATASPSSYELQVRKPDATQVVSYNGITTTTKNIKASVLPSNAPYKFKVRAVAADSTVTTWSIYKAFRTLPGTPRQLQVQPISAHSSYFSWKNVARSSNLQYYKVQVKRGNATVFSKRVRTGLHNARTGTAVTNVQSGKRYTFKVQAVARSTSKSEYASYVVRLP